MNYRHAFHAGNHADVLKHACLHFVLARLLEKPKPVFVLDTHAGRGLYDFDSDAARRSPEYEAGVARILAASEAPTLLQRYIEAVRHENPFNPVEGKDARGGLRWYAGSPEIVRQYLRAEDRAAFCELHPVERESLEQLMTGDRRITVSDRDGYEALRGLLPPPEREGSRRGLVLIDPPFEKPGEFDRLARALTDGMRRFANGVYMIWYPVKDASGLVEFKARAATLRPQKALYAELYIKAAASGVMSGSGLYIVNPPYGLADALAEALPFLARTLQQAPGAGWRLFAHEGEAVIHDRNETMT